MEAPDPENIQPNQGDDDHDDDEEEEEEQKQYCTFAVSGPQPIFQAIFVCHSSSSSPANDNDKQQQALLCICQACANTCHEHDQVEYIGMGLSYCDCHQIGTSNNGGGGTAARSCCRIQADSQAEAEKLGVAYKEGAATVTNRQRPITTVEQSQIFRIPTLANDRHVCQVLQHQAIELVKHTRDSFWLDARGSSRERSSLATEQQFCDLERLALCILERHVEDFNMQRLDCGAEWWVQVKPLMLSSSPSSSSSSGSEQSELPVLESQSNAAEAVDLHYDKDEALAESFDIGVFPTLSTVTYLTDSTTTTKQRTRPPPPTVVFSRHYEEGEVSSSSSSQDGISHMLLSHPRRGKHLVFDGRLMHGAPSHFALREQQVVRHDTDESVLVRHDDNDDNNNQLLRITFLVNIWEQHRPAGVLPLPDRIRAAIQQNVTQLTECALEGTALSFQQAAPIDQAAVASLDDLPIRLRSVGRIELPYVGKGATWCDDDDGTALVLLTYPPPPHERDSILVNFGPGMEAYINYLPQGSDDDDEEDEEEEDQ